MTITKKNLTFPPHIDPAVVLKSCLMKKVEYGQRTLHTGTVHYSSLEYKSLATGAFKAANLVYR
jgi:hypothetical protein